MIKGEGVATPQPDAEREGQDIAVLAKGGRTNIFGFVLRLTARLPFLFIAGRVYGAETVGRFAFAVLIVELAALVATLGLKRGLAQALSTTDRPHSHVVWDGMAVAFLASASATAVLFAFPQMMYPNSEIYGLERLLPLVVFAVAWSDISLAALAYRLNLKATVWARAVVEPWTISVAALALSYVSTRDGLIISYVLSMIAALLASLIPFLKSYGIPHGWKPHVAPIIQLTRANIPLAGADALEWASRNVDRFILGLFFGPAIVGIYYMAQQVASLPQRLKTSFDPILGPVVTQSLADGDKAAVARQVRQVAYWIMTAQLLLALMGAVPGEAVMGVIGPAFVSGTAALAFLLFAEVFASQGAVSESALVYMARHRNLMISSTMLGIQVVLSIGLILLARRLSLPETYAAAGPALALAITVAVASFTKAALLKHLTQTPVWGFRWALIAAGVIAAGVGTLFTRLPEWAELSFGLPAIVATYALVIWRYGLTDDDRALFRKSTAAPTVSAESVVAP